jgi:hypothetical protein
MHTIRWTHEGSVFASAQARAQIPESRPAILPVSCEHPIGVIFFRRLLPRTQLKMHAPHSPQQSPKIRSALRI